MPRDATIRALRPSVAAVAAVASRVAPALVLVALAIWEIVAVRGAPGQVPGDAAWARAAAAVRAEHHAGELIVFAPRWVEPVGRMHLGDLIPLAMAARLDGARYGVIWELSIRGARAAETAGLRPSWRGDFGGVTVRRFERAPAELLADLVAATPTVTGAHVGGPGVEAIAEVGFEPHRCTQVSLVRGQDVRLAYAAVPLGTTLAIGVGLADVFTRRDERAPLRFRVAIDGAVVAERWVGVDDGWIRIDVPTTPGAGAVEIHVGLPSTPACTPGAGAARPPAGCRTARPLCFAVEARR